MIRISSRVFPAVFPLTILAALLVAHPALAGQGLWWDSVKFKVGPVRGRVVAVEDLEISSIQAAVSCHFCKATTCAGGPHKLKEIETSFELLDAHSALGTEYEFAAGAGGGRLRAWDAPFPPRLNRCEYVLKLIGIEKSTATPVKGVVSLASSSVTDSRPIWKDPTLNQKITKRILGAPLEVRIRKPFFPGEEPTIVEVDPR